MLNPLRQHFHVDTTGLNVYTWDNREYAGLEAPVPDKEQWFINIWGDKMCFRNGLRHCSTGPAVISEEQTLYYINDELHRDTGPAWIFADGNLWWYKNGKQTRKTGPAEISRCGIRYFTDGVLTRENNLPAQIHHPAENHINQHVAYWYNNRLHNPIGPARIFPDGTIEYYVNGELHNVNGPAKSDNGLIEYRVKGKLHNVKGPAKIYPPEANKPPEYWVKGKRLRNDVFFLMYGVL